MTRTKIALFAIPVLVAILIGAGFANPAFAKNVNCVFKTDLVFCRGGQPEIGDSISAILPREGKGPCTGTITDVDSFDDAEDREGNIAIEFDPPCGSVLGTGGTAIRIIGPL